MYKHMQSAFRRKHPNIAFALLTFWNSSDSFHNEIPFKCISLLFVPVWYRKTPIFSENAWLFSQNDRACIWRQFVSKLSRGQLLFTERYSNASQIDLIIHQYEKIDCCENSNWASHWYRGLKLGFWNIRSRCKKWKVLQEVEKLSERYFVIGILAETRMESYDKELAGWHILNSGNKIDTRPKMEINFVAREKLNSNFCPISNGFATLAHKLGTVRLELIRYYTPTEASEYNKAKKPCTEDWRKSPETCPLNANTSIYLVTSLAELESTIGSSPVDSIQWLSWIIRKWNETAKPVSWIWMKPSKLILQKKKILVKIHLPSLNRNGSSSWLYLDKKIQRNTYYRASRIAEAKSDHNLVTAIIKNEIPKRKKR